MWYQPGILSALLAVLMLVQGPLLWYLAACRRRRACSVGPDTLVLSLLAGLSATSLVGVLLLSCRAFTLGWLLALHGLLVAVWVVGLLRGERVPLTWRGPGRDPKRWAAYLAALAGLGFALALRLPPSLYVFGAQDQGVYVSIAAHYVADGEIGIHDPLVKMASAGTQEEREVFAPLFPADREPGFYIDDRVQGIIVPQFYVLHPIWLALFWFVLGPTGSFYALPFFGLLSLIAVYYLCRELLPGHWPGVFAGALLAANLLQVWVNRYPLSESLAEFWLVAGLWLYLRWRRTGESAEMWLSVAALGLAAFTRFDVILLLPAYVIAFLLSRGDRRDTIYYNAVIGLQLLSLTYAAHFDSMYLYTLVADRFRHAPYLLWWQVALLAAVGMALMNVLKRIGLSEVWDRLAERLLRVRLGLLLAAALAGLAFLAVKHAFSSPESRVVQFSWYVTAPGVGAALVGLCLLVRFWVLTRERLLIGLLFTAIWGLGLVVLHTNGYQFYYGRYYASEVLPVAAVCLAALLAAVWRFRSVFPRAAGALAAGALVVAFVLPYVSNPAARLEELAGGYEAVQTVASQLPPNSVTFVANGESWELATPLWHVASRYAIPLSYPEIDTPGAPLARSGAFSRAARLLVSRHIPTYLLYTRTSSPVAFSTADVTCVPVISGQSSVATSEQVLHVPHQVLLMQIPWVLYQVMPRIADSRIRLPIGLVAKDGFYTDVGFDWSEGHATLRGIDVPPGRPLRLSLRLAGGIPPGLPMHLRVSVANRQLLDENTSSDALDAAGEVGPITVPADLNQGRLAVDIASTDWSPHQVTPGSDDTRRLSLDIVEVVVTEDSGGATVAPSPRGSRSG